MSALDNLTSQPFTPPAADTGGAVSKLMATNPPAQGGVSSLISKPFVPLPAAPAAQSPYFQAKDTKTGAFMGISDQTDPYSGRPYFAYQLPGEATTTDKTRVAPKTDPRVAAPTPRADFTNPRMPESASEAIRKEEGASAADQLDHRMALSVGGSNDSANLKLIPTDQNQAAGKDEGQLSSDIASGNLSLFDAQMQEAKNKGLPTPWIDAATPPAKANLLTSIFRSPDNTVLGQIRNTILGLPAAAGTVAKTGVNTIAGIAQGLKEQYTNPSLLEQKTEALVNLPPLLKAPAVAIARTFEPMVEPLVNDISAGIIFNNPDLYNSFVSNIAKNGPNGLTQNTLDATQKSAVQVVGDTAQAVLAAYMPELPAEGIADAEAKQSIVKALPGIFLHGAAAGTTFGAAQAASSGITDPKELAAIVLKNTIAGGLLNVLGVVATHGGIHATAPVIKAIQERLPENLYEAQRGFVRNPFPAPEKTLSPEEMKTGTEPVNQLAHEEPQPSPVAGEVNPAHVDKYIEQFGNELNTDNARELFPAYQEDRTRSAEVHEPASAIVKAAYDKLLDEKKGEGNNTVLFTSGGTGAGKTTAIRSLENADEFPIIYDTNTSEVKSSATKIDQALAKGYEVEINYVHNDISNALDNALGRAERMRGELGSGRTVPLDEHIKTHIGAPSTYIDLAEKYHDDPRVRFVAIDNTGNNPRPIEDPLAFAKNKVYNVSNEELRGKLEQQIKNAPISEETKRGFLGGTKQEKTRVSESSKNGSSNGAGDAKGKEIGQITKGKLGDPVADLAASARTAKEFSFALTPEEVDKVYDAVDPDRVNYTPEEAAKAYYENVRANVLPPDKGAMQHVSTITPSKTLEKTNPTLAHNGGFEPPENKGILTAPEIDWSTGKDIAAVRLSTDTMERNVEKIFPKDTAEKINQFLVEHVRKNETDRVRYVNDLRADIKRVVVDKLGIKARSRDSELLQQYGEGRISLDELKKSAPKNWDDIVIAKDYMRSKYDKLLDHWNRERSKAGLKPITKRPNYFRHFVELSDFASKFGFDFKESNLPTAISGITDYFKSQTPWAGAAMRRIGTFTTDDAVSGLDNYLDTASRAIFHTDSVQRGRLIERYLRGSADANNQLAIKAIDESKPDDAPPPIKLPNFAANLNDWVNIVSGKQARLDRAIESVLGRPALGVLRTLTRRFGLNVIGGNISAAVTHAIPLSYTLATVDKGAAFQGLIDTLHSPFLADTNTIAGQESAFLTRRFPTQEIQKTIGETVATAMMAPFHVADLFISRFAVSAKYMEGVAKGLNPQEAMRQADNYAGRVIGDRSVGNLPTLMSTKTLGLITQFQIEVNDNLHVLLHDVPKWAEGDKAKIANTIVQFAIYSFLFNQTMQFIKGSGKGLDPIDLGLTLAGINDEGHDKTMMQRLALVGGDFLKELPFTSLLNGGQVPALEPIKTAVTDAASGNEMKALTGILASFASPVGGGQQLQKSLTGIQAWQQGVVKDSNGNVIAIIPRTVPQLLQGALFGKNAFPEVKKGKGEVSNLDATIKQQQALGTAKNQQAQDIWDQMKGLDPAAAKQQLKDIADSDPDMAKRVLKAAQDEAKGITKQDTLIKTLGVASGARAQYIVSQIQGMSTDTEKKQYLSDLAKKGLLSATVLDQIVTLMKK